MRFFHPTPITGEKIETSAITRRTDRTNGREFYAVNVPPAYRQILGPHIECAPGSIVFSSPEVGRGFNVIPPDDRSGFIDIPDHIPAETVKGIAPHLMSEDEVREHREKSRSKAAEQSAQQPQKPGGDPKSQRT